MRYIELAVHVSEADAVTAAEVLRTSTGAGVSIEHAFTQPDLDYGPQPGQGPASVRAFVPADTDRGDVILAAREALSLAGIPSELEVRTVADEDWAEAWKEHFQVERYGEHIVVVPSWRTYEALPQDVVFTLDPGMAFGTGQHETTRMCLEALERAVVPGMRVLDVGCGSGILAIAAARLGAREVVALDIDPICVDVTRHNAAINAVAIAVAHGSLGQDWPTGCGTAQGFDVVVANIIAAAIIELAPHLAGSLSPGGRLITSGIIATREEAVVAALRAEGLRVDSSRTMGDWRCIEAAKL